MPENDGKRPRRGGLRLMLVALITVGSCYLLICALLFVFQERLVYLPSRQLGADPAQIGLAFEDQRIQTADGISLHAWWVPADGASRGALLFCHGNAGNISHRLETLRILHELDLDVLLFDYRGYGRSEGTPSEDGTYADVAACHDWLTARGVAPERLIVMGRSLGAAPAVWLAEQRPAAALIMESPFRSLPAVAADHYPWLPTGWLCRFAYDNEQRLTDMRLPMLLLHSRDDRIVPYHHGRQLADMLGERAEFVELRGDHNSGFLLTPGYQDRLAGFVERALPLVPAP